MNGNYYAPKTPAESKRILLVEDDPNFGTVLKDYLLWQKMEWKDTKNSKKKPSTYAS